MQNLLKRISYMESLGRFIEITDILDEYNVRYEIQEDYDGWSRDMLRNIIVHLGDCSKPANVALSAHWDIVPGSCGANDNGAACVILLLFIKRYIESGVTTPLDIIFFDKEETGFSGSHSYIRTFLFENERKNNFTIINLDVCGCGDDIVAINELKDGNPYEYNMFNDDIMKEYDIAMAVNFPPSDVLYFRRNKIDNVSISVFPRNDTRYLASVPLTKEEHKKIKNHEDIAQTIISQHNDKLWRKNGFHFLEIYKYMHCAKYDDIKYINFDIMNKLLNYLTNAFINKAN